MKKCRVTFQPFTQSVEVEEGLTLSEAARKAGIFINNLCGGEGVCGECRVRIVKGGFEQDKSASSFFSREEIEEGNALACRIKVHDDLQVEVFPESLLDEGHIMTGDSLDVLVSGEAPRFLHKPLARKVFLELQAPTLEDNISDLERVSRELRRRIGRYSFDISLQCLKKLSMLLRDNGWKATVTVLSEGQGYRILEVEGQDTTKRQYGVAVDVGTTTVVGQLVDLRSGRILGVEGTQNMQTRYGEDVISRIIFACRKDGSGLHLLQAEVVKNINGLIESLAGVEGITREEISIITASGNTTMSHLLLGLTPGSIRMEPYVPTADVYPRVIAADTGVRIHPQGVMETLPGVASYVGGDIVAGVISSGIAEKEALQGIIDIGTNGEIAIGNSDWLVCCSASAGPSFEGGGTTCGMRATRGAIESVKIEDGKVTYQTIGNAAPRGICGSGLIDCIYELVKNRIIGYDGKFDRYLDDPRLSITEGIPAYAIAEAGETESGEVLSITEPDIDNLIKSKGSVFAALKALVDYMGLSFDMLDTFYVAGGFGSHLNIHKAVGIGLLPDIPEERIRFIGNSSLAGARMALISESAFEKCKAVAKSMTNVELSSFQPYMNEYVASLFLPHTDRKLFPSVEY